jgi:hypothetical protein
MLQSVRNVLNVDFSFNSKLRQVIGMSNSAPISSSILLNDKNEEIDQENSESSSSSENNENRVKDEILRETLCLDQLDLSNCAIQRVPNMQHTCVNKIDLSENDVQGKTHLVISLFSVYFLDYLDLKGNNVTKLSLIVSNEKYENTGNILSHL